jgi:hypothetical protein
MTAGLSGATITALAARTGSALSTATATAGRTRSQSSIGTYDCARDISGANAACWHGNADRASIGRLP